MKKTALRTPFELKMYAVMVKQRKTINRLLNEKSILELQKDYAKRLADTSDKSERLMYDRYLAIDKERDNLLKAVLEQQSEIEKLTKKLSVYEG